ncbi:hypothetical protein ABIC60_004660 [Phyllobacterium ifriqiyense]
MLIWVHALTAPYLNPHPFLLRPHLNARRNHRMRLLDHYSEVTPLTPLELYSRSFEHLPYAI